MRLRPSEHLLNSLDVFVPQSSIALGGADAVDEIAAIVKAQMEGAAALSVPLTVGVGIGENWKDGKS